METPSLIQCPVCNKRYPRQQIDSHVNLCLGEPDDVNVVGVQPSASLKKRKSDSLTAKDGDGWAFMMASSSTKKFKQESNYNDTVVIRDSESNGSTSGENSVGNKQLKDMKDGDKCVESSKHICIEDLTVPLAEYMRPKTFDTYVGQEKAMGSTSILRSLINSKHLPSLILWGPPGCGKVRNTHINCYSMVESLPDHRSLTIFKVKAYAAAFFFFFPFFERVCKTD